MFTAGLSIAALLALFIGAPGSLFLFGLWFFRRAKTPFGRVLPGVMTVVGAAGLSVVGLHLYRSAPGHSGILAAGASPDGREYCLVQSHNGFPEGLGEPYTVALFVRDNEGKWRWHYVDHESLRWANGSVVFEDESVHTYEDTKLYRSVELNLGPPDAEHPWVDANDLPAELSANQVAERHLERHRH